MQGTMQERSFTLEIMLVSLAIIFGNAEVVEKEFRCSRKDYHNPCHTKMIVTGLNETDADDANGIYEIIESERFNRPVYQNGPYYIFYTPVSWIIGKDYKREGGVVAAQDKTAGLCPDSAFDFAVYTKSTWTKNYSETVNITGVGFPGHIDGTPDYVLHGTAGYIHEFRGSSVAPESSCERLAEYLNKAASGESAADRLELESKFSFVEDKATNNSDLVTAVRNSVNELEVACEHTDTKVAQVNGTVSENEKALADLQEKFASLENKFDSLLKKYNEFEASTASGGDVTRLFTRVTFALVFISLLM